MTNYVEFKGITKDFPGVRALDNVSFRLESGKVTAFLGENGAGKSTLLKILNGDYIATSGEYLIQGKPVEFHSPKEAIEAGISVIYQERQILLELSVAENIFAGALPHSKLGVVDQKRLYKKTQDILDEFGLDFSPNQKVKHLSVAHQQMVEIMKAYNRNSSVIAFDEPSASLSDSEIDILFTIIRRLKSEGKVIVYVTHRMKEIHEISDQVVVFKDGKFVAQVAHSEVTDRELVRLMVGRDLGYVFEHLQKGNRTNEELLRLENVSTKAVSDISFTLHRGEILGFAGLVGAGRSEVMNAIFGIDRITSGVVYMKGQKQNIHLPKDAIQAGIGLCPEDRKLEGIFPLLSVEKNISTIMFSEYANIFGVIHKQKEEELCLSYIKELQIKTPSKDKAMQELSGGNQQKVILSRVLARNPEILILDEPTKGIDVGAKFDFYQLICDCAKRGIGVMVISSELPEVIGVSDRIIVMKERRIAGEIDANGATEEQILALAMLHKEPHEGVDHE